MQELPQLTLYMSIFIKDEHCQTKFDEILPKLPTINDIIIVSSRQRLDDLFSSLLLKRRECLSLSFCLMAE